MRTLITAALAALIACAKPPAAEQCPPATADWKQRLPSDKLIAEWPGGKLRYGELMERRAAKLRAARNAYLQQVHTIERETAESFVVASLVEAEAKTKGMDPESFAQSLAGDPAVSQDEIQKFYDAQVAASGTPLEAVRARIVGHLVDEKRRAAIAEGIAKLQEKAGVKYDLPPPAYEQAKLPTEGRPTKGDPKAPVTLVAFSDFECPYCARAVPEVERLAKAYEGKVKIVFLHFPLEFHAAARPAAVAAECAHRQGKFWPMHDKLFEHHKALSRDKFVSIAQEIGLELPKFETCLDDPSAWAQVEADVKVGDDAGVEGTPAFYVDGVPYPHGVPTVEALKPVIPL